MTVYADLLFIVNLYIDALLLSAVRRFLRLPLTGKRLLLASVLGGVFGLSALLPALPGVVLFPLALLESLALCAAAFAPKPMTQLLKAVFLLFLFGAALSGLLTAAAYFLPIHGILLANGAVYFNISALTLILLTCVSYGVLYGFDRLFRKKEPDVFFAKLTITRQGKTVTLPAKIDTGADADGAFFRHACHRCRTACARCHIAAEFRNAKHGKCCFYAAHPVFFTRSGRCFARVSAGCGFAFGHINQMLGGRDRPHAFRREFSGARRRRRV